MPIHERRWMTWLTLSARRRRRAWKLSLTWLSWTILTTLSPFWTGVQSVKPDLVLTCTDLNMSAMLLTTMREMGIAAPFVGGKELTQSAFLAQLAEDVGTIYAICPTQGAYRQAVSRFAKAYVDRFKQPLVAPEKAYRFLLCRPHAAGRHRSRRA